MSISEHLDGFFKNIRKKMSEQDTRIENQFDKTKADSFNNKITNAALLEQ